MRHGSRAWCKWSDLLAFFGRCNLVSLNCIIVVSCFYFSLCRFAHQRERWIDFILSFRLLNGIFCLSIFKKRKISTKNVNFITTTKKKSLNIYYFFECWIYFRYRMISKLLTILYSTWNNHFSIDKNRWKCIAMGSDVMTRLKS